MKAAAKVALNHDHLRNIAKEDQHEPEEEDGRQQNEE